MREFKMFVLYTSVILIIITGIICAIILPEEGKIVEYRLEAGSNETIGQYPLICAVVENGRDFYISFKDKTMDEGIEILNQFNETLKE